MSGSRVVGSGECASSTGGSVKEPVCTYFCFPAAAPRSLLRTFMAGTWRPPALLGAGLSRAQIRGEDAATEVVAFSQSRVITLLPAGGNKHSQILSSSEDCRKEDRDAHQKRSTPGATAAQCPHTCCSRTRRRS
ncbi:hypothetical protein MRX96_035547 [Rhipicephalus microplus]